MSLLHHDARLDAFDFTSHFREDLYACLTARGDTLFEIADAMPCEDGPVNSPVGLPLWAEHRRSHGALYDALNCGNIDAGGRRAWSPPTNWGRHVERAGFRVIGHRERIGRHHRHWRDVVLLERRTAR